METEKIVNYLEQVDAFTLQPEKFLSFQKEEAEEIKLLTKNLYNFSKKKESIKNARPDALDALVVEGLDEEQIWQQIDLQNSVIFDSLVKEVSHLLAKKDELQFPLKSKKKKLQEKKKKEILKKQKLPEKVEEDGENFFFEYEKNIFKKKKPGKSSVVDDKFFKLHEMEEFLEKIERDEDNFDNEGIDLFEEEDSSNSNDEYQIHYKDFFDQPEEIEDRKRRNEDAEEQKKMKKLRMSLENDVEEDLSEDIEEEEEEENEEEKEEEEEDDEDEEEEKENGEGESDEIDGEIYRENEKVFNDDGEDEDNEEEDDEEEEDEKEPQQLSTFENRQRMLKSRINALEEEALKEKPWQMTGEVTAQSRPQNSLLEEYVEFDIASRPRPVLTEKSTLKLEDIIIQRIKDKAWDDVQRKIKPSEQEIEYKKRLVLDQEKSKLSLAQIYEQDYLKQLDTKNESLIDKPEVEPPEHKEIRIMMNKLFSKLDALSNFHFTPKQVEPEIKIISNVPAINMEEVAPVAASDAALLAPEEVKTKSKGDLIGKSERTSTDKKRERRKKKLIQKLKYRKIEAKAKRELEKPNSKGLKSSNLSQKLLERITKSSNVTKLKENEGKFVKSQKAIFSKLEDERNSKGKKKFEIKNPKVGKKLKGKKS